MTELTNDRWQRIDSLFAAALDEEPARRDAFLGRACGTDHELHQAVLALLQASTRSASFLETPLFTLAEGLVAKRPGAADEVRRNADGVATPDSDMFNVSTTAYVAVRDPLGLAGLMHAWFGCSAFWINRPGEAVQVLSRIDMKRGDLRGYWQAWSCWAYAHHHLGGHRNELKVVREGRTLYPDEAMLLRHEGMALAALGRPQEAARLVDALQLLPAAQQWAGGDVPNWIARELRAHGHAAEARELYQRSVEWYRARPNVGRTCWSATRMHYLAALMGAELFDEAETVARDLAAAEPENPYCQGYLGVIAARRGDVAGAERVSAWLAEHMPPYQGWLNHYWRARIAAQLGHRQQAVELLRQAFGQGGAMYWWGTYHAEADLEPLRGYPPFEEFMRPKG